jgi:hypothetical protein
MCAGRYNLGTGNFKTPGGGVKNPMAAGKQPFLYNSRFQIIFPIYFFVV